jgi:hypothetical protein
MEGVCAFFLKWSHFFSTHNHGATAIGFWIFTNPSLSSTHTELHVFNVDHSTIREILL